MKLLSIHRLSVSGYKLPVLPANLAAILPVILPVILSLQILACTALHCARAEEAPVPLIFDTDMGNDCDDALALAMIHALQSRKECELLAVTITKDHELAAPFVDCLNTFYGRGNIPIGVCRNSGKTPDAGKYNQVSKITDNGKLRFEHDLLSGNNAPTAVEVLRRTLAQAQDASVVVVQVGFSTNLANLLASPADAIAPLSGRELFAKKVKLVSIMAGAFAPIPNDQGVLGEHREYNVAEDIPSIKKLVELCDVPILWSGFEIGLNLTYPHQSILQDYRYVPHHPVAEAYIAYIPPPHDRPTWDLTSVLAAVRPDRGYFELSNPGTVTISDDAISRFAENPQGKHRYLILKPATAERTREALVQLSSQPPEHCGSSQPAPNNAR
jgi:inosine-uridine nucleoside N-ribohydrolase